MATQENTEAAGHEAQKKGAAIPHENSGGREIMEQETGAGPGQGKTQSSAWKRAHGQPHQPQKEQHDGGETGGETVHVVEEVEGIGQGHNPNNGKGRSED